MQYAFEYTFTAHDGIIDKHIFNVIPPIQTNYSGPFKFSIAISDKEKVDLVFLQELVELVGLTAIKNQMINSLSNDYKKWKEKKKFSFCCFSSVYPGPSFEDNKTMFTPTQRIKELIDIFYQQSCRLKHPICSTAEWNIFETQLKSAIISATPKANDDQKEIEKPRRNSQKLKKVVIVRENENSTIPTNSNKATTKDSATLPISKRGSTSEAGLKTIKKKSNPNRKVAPLSNFNISPTLNSQIALPSPSTITGVVVSPSKHVLYKASSTVSQGSQFVKKMAQKTTHNVSYGVSQDIDLGKKGEKAIEQGFIATSGAISGVTEGMFQGMSSFGNDFTQSVEAVENIGQDFVNAIESIF